MKSSNKKLIPYTLEEAEKICAFHGAPAAKCPLEDDRFFATVEELERLRWILREHDRKLTEIWGKEENPYAAAYGWVKISWDEALKNK